MKNVTIKHSLTEGPILKTLLLFSLPMIAGNLLQQIYNITDTLIVSRFCSVSCKDGYYVVTGAGTVCSGAPDREHARRVLNEMSNTLFYIVGNPDGDVKNSNDAGGRLVEQFNLNKCRS